MKIKGLMISVLLTILVSTIGAAQEVPVSSVFFTLYGQVSNGTFPENGATVTLTINGITKTTLTAPNSRGEVGFYQFELANFPDVIAGSPMTLSATKGVKSVSRTTSRAIVEPQREDIQLAPEGDIKLSVDAPARSTVANVKATYVLIVDNPGDATETYYLTIQNPTIAIAGLNIPSITLEAHGRGIVYLDVSSATAGSFVVNVTATYPKDGAPKSATITTNTTVYPGRGKITGVGTILSANFNVNAIYPNGNSAANGNVDYRNSTANLNIKSIQIDLVGTTLDKKKGVITGLAQVNGAGSYYFEVYAEDNGKSGFSDVFRIYLPTYPYSVGPVVLSTGDIKIS